MRRIYESSALRRDDDSPFEPNERESDRKPRAARTVPAEALSRTLVPRWLRNRAVSVGVSSPASVYRREEAVPFTVEMKNAMPFPITIPTRSPLRWSWYVDDVREASHVAETPPKEPGALVFDRGERKSFGRNWQQVFRVSESEWEAVPPGEYTIGAALDVDDPTGKGLYDETTVRIE